MSWYNSTATSVLKIYNASSAILTPVRLNTEPTASPASWCQHPMYFLDCLGPIWEKLQALLAGQIIEDSSSRGNSVRLPSRQVTTDSIFPGTSTSRSPGPNQLPGPKGQPIPPRHRRRHLFRRTRPVTGRPVVKKPGPAALLPQGSNMAGGRFGLVLTHD